jgi:hypothetical protein
VAFIVVDLLAESMPNLQDLVLAGIHRDDGGDFKLQGLVVFAIARNQALAILPARTARLGPCAATCQFTRKMPRKAAK